jgi:hypothetical protein
LPVEFFTSDEYTNKGNNFIEHFIKEFLLNCDAAPPNVKARVNKLSAMLKSKYGLEEPVSEEEKLRNVLKNF